MTSHNMKRKFKILIILILSLSVLLFIQTLTVDRSTVLHKKDVLSNNNFRKYQISDKKEEKNIHININNLYITPNTNKNKSFSDADNGIKDPMKKDFVDFKSQKMPYTKKKQSNSDKGALADLFENMKMTEKENVDESMYRDSDFDYFKIRENSKIIQNNRTISNCITGNVIGKYLDHSQIRLATINETVETVSERKKSFEEVFKTRAWGHDWDPSHKGLNASGMGATLFWTQEFMGALHVVLNNVKKYLGKEVLRILDVPCGDMVWMSRFLQTRQDIRYTGIDIVPDLINNHKKTYARFRHWRFLEADILDPNIIIDDYDLIVNRMMLQHLYFDDVIRLLEKFSDSGSHFILLTTFPSHPKNEELKIDPHENQGRFRYLNLEIPPLSLAPPECLQRDGPIHAFEGWAHFVGLWNLPLKRVQFCDEDRTFEYKIRFTPVTVHSCTSVLSV